ncbi:unnamed protein product [Urochloa humidicola]
MVDAAATTGPPRHRRFKNGNTASGGSTLRTAPTTTTTPHRYRRRARDPRRRALTSLDPEPKGCGISFSMTMGGRPVDVNPLHTTPNEIRKTGTKRHRLMFRLVGSPLNWILLRPLRPRRRTEQ